MNALQNLRIGTRLAIAFGLMLGMLLIMAGVGLSQVSAINEFAAYYPENIVPSLRIIKDITQDVSDGRRLEAQLIMVEDAAERDKLAQRIEETRGKTKAHIKDYEPLVSDATDGGLMKKSQELAEGYFVLQKEVVTMALAGVNDPTQMTRAKALTFGDERKAYYDLQSNVDAWWKYNETLSDQTKLQAETAHRRVLWVFGVVTVAALALGVFAAVTITRGILGPVARASAAARAVAQGDLTQRTPSTAHDEIGQLLNTLDEMTQSLAGMVAEVRNGCDQLNGAAAEIAQGNGDLSARTESQASNLEQTAASVEQMAAAIKTNADNANQADQLAGHAAKVAHNGGEAVGRVVATMDDIHMSSRRIEEIIAVIDGIAFQTNILALNAAVEAARAGEQGRGFAVVAAEVRSLAQRSANAAKEIKTLINESVAKVSEGSTLVHGARNTIDEMVSEVTKVAHLVGEITLSSREQAGGVAQINVAVSQLDEATQQNAALVEQTAAAAESMRQQTRKLSEAVAIFKVDAGAASSHSSFNARSAA